MAALRRAEAMADCEILRCSTWKGSPATWIVELWPDDESESCFSFAARSSSRVIAVDFMFVGVKGGTYAKAAQVRIVF